VVVVVVPLLVWRVYEQFVALVQHKPVGTPLLVLPEEPDTSVCGTIGGIFDALLVHFDIFGGLVPLLDEFIQTLLHPLDLLLELGFISPLPSHIERLLLFLQLLLQILDGLLNSLQGVILTLEVLLILVLLARILPALFDLLIEGVMEGGGVDNARQQGLDQVVSISDAVGHPRLVLLSPEVADDRE
jgi:hypothetical protein